MFLYVIFGSLIVNFVVWSWVKLNLVDLLYIKEGGVFWKKNLFNDFLRRKKNDRKLFIEGNFEILIILNFFFLFWCEENFVKKSYVIKYVFLI